MSLLLKTLLETRRSSVKVKHVRLVIVFIRADDDVEETTVVLVDDYSTRGSCNQTPPLISIQCN